LEKSTGERTDLEMLGEFSQEFGEAVRSILMHHEVKVRKQEDNIGKIGKECFDVLYNLFVLAAKYDVDLETEFARAIGKYEDRFGKDIWKGLESGN
jgi:NTP pyrophosphatase (non-canonical NTP hydrolase)